jgi:glycogen operon protein
MLGATFHDPGGKYVLHAMFNAHWEAHDFELPERADGQPRHWRRWVDTALESPDDILRWNEAPRVTAPRYRVQPRATAFLISATN